MVRRRIEIKLVKNKSARLVTFCKRRSGVFKKAKELSIMCGTQVGMIVFSPGDKPFAFGHPSIEAVINKFLSKDSDIDDEKVNKELEGLMNKIQVEKNKGKTLHNNAINKDKHIIKGKFNIGGLGLEDLQKLRACLAGITDELNLSINVMEAASSLLLLAEKPVERDSNLIE